MNAGVERIPTTSTAATSTTCATAHARSFPNADRPRRWLKKALRQASWTIRPGIPTPSTSSDGRSVPPKRNAAAMQHSPARAPSTSATPVAAAAPVRHSASEVAL